MCDLCGQDIENCPYTKEKKEEVDPSWFTSPLKHEDFDKAKKKKGKKMKTHSTSCLCVVQFFAPAEALELYACQMHKDIFLVTSMLCKEDTIGKRNEAAHKLEDAWQEYVWNHGTVIERDEPNE